jgi:MoaA/NifB/PqqE/SkfB family radical SAM enzyme
MMKSYSQRKVFEYLLRKLPNFISNTIVDIANPLRKSDVIKNINPRWITLFITNYCSARCGHCFYSKELNNKIEELNFENLKKIFLSLKKPLNTLRVTGGEPFLNKSTDDFYNFIDKNKISKKVSITTHGMIPNLEARVKKMIENSSNTHLHIGVSLDGLEKTHNDFRKIKNGFQLAIKNLLFFKEFSEKNTKFTFSTTTSLIREICTTKNSDQKIELLDLLDYLSNKVGVTSMGFDHVRSVENDVFNVPKKILSSFGLPPKSEETKVQKHTRADDVQLDINEIKEINTILKKSGYLSNDYLTMRRLEIEQEILKNKKRVVDCLAGYVDCVIYPSLDVAICESTKPFANLKNFNFDLINLLKSNQANETRSLASKCACTHPCHLSDSLAYDKKFLKEYFSSNML